jgi:solute carrier family 25 (mitochondrial phosphate transporter), member 3
VFKYLYGEKLFPSVSKTAIFPGASASAEFLANIALCPFKAVGVRMQTTLPPFANTIREGLSKVIKQEGMLGEFPSFLLPN